MNPAIVATSWMSKRPPLPLWLMVCKLRKKKLCLPPSVTGEVYCFPRHQLIFSFDWRVIYHLKGLWEYILKSIPSVCSTIFKRIVGHHFYPESLMLNINRFVSSSSINKYKAFFKFQISFWNFGRKPRILTEKKIKRIARREYWSKGNVLYINGFVLTSSTN